MKVGEIVDAAQAVISANAPFLAIVGVNPMLIEGGNFVIDLAQSVIDKWGSAPRDQDVTQEEINAEADAAIGKTRARTAEYDKVEELTEDEDGDDGSDS